MITYGTRGCLLVTLLCAGWQWSQPCALATEGSSSTATGAGGTNAVLNLNRLSGFFTVTDVQVVNGVTEASGFVTADATDSVGLSVNLFTNIPVKMPMPVDTPLGGKAGLIGKLDGYVPPPTLSTNLCTILAISVAFVDVTVPGLGLNVHVNQLLLGVRADKETRLGNVLCTILGEDVGLGITNGVPVHLSIRLQGNKVVVEGTSPGTLQASPNLRQASSWSDTLGQQVQALSQTGALQFLIAPTEAAQFFRLTVPSNTITNASKNQ